MPHISPPCRKKQEALDRKWGIYNELCRPSCEPSETFINPEHHPVMYEQAKDHCDVRGITPEQEMMIGIAWVLPFELKQFQLFHVVIHVDATMKTNLVTVPSKDSQNHMFTVL